MAILSTTLWATQFLEMVDYRALEGSGHCCQLDTYKFLGLGGRAELWLGQLSGTMMKWNSSGHKLDVAFPDQGATKMKLVCLGIGPRQLLKHL